MLKVTLSVKKRLILLITFPLFTLTACQSLPQPVTQSSSQGYESPIPVHVSGFTGVKF